MTIGPKDLMTERELRMVREAKEKVDDWLLMNCSAESNSIEVFVEEELTEKGFEILIRIYQRAGWRTVTQSGIGLLLEK